VILVELLSGSPALQGWLGDRARLLRGEARWNGELPVDLPRVRELAQAMMAPDPAARPSAAEAARVLSSL
jgi:hypothetical protein